MFLSKKSIILGILAGGLLVGSVKSDAPDHRKMPMGSPMMRGGGQGDMAKTSIAQIEKLAENMRDANMKEAVTAIGHALRALDAKIDHVQTKRMKKPRKGHMRKDAADRGQKAALRKAARAGQ